MARKDFETIKEWVEDSLDAHFYNRDLQRRDRDFYDGRQLTQEEVNELNKRGQPAVVINMIQRKINGLRGAFIDLRTDPRAFPRTPTHDEDDEVLTDALRYVDDNTDFSVKATEVATNVCIEGEGAMLLGLKECASGELEITAEHIDQDRLIIDPHSRRADYSDAMYLGFGTWMDMPEAEARWPKRKTVLEDAKSGNAPGNIPHNEDKPEIWFDTNRDRVWVVELYYQSKTRVKGKLRTVWYGCQLTLGGFLEDPFVVPYHDDSPDENSFCPLMVVSGFIDRDGYRYGAVRSMISPQEEINKRRSKFLHRTTMRQMVYEEGAVESIDEALQEAAKPDGAIKVNRGALADGRFQFADNPQFDQAEFQLYQAAHQELESIGPNAALFSPGKAQDISGTSFMAQQQAGMREMGPIFDNMKQFVLRCYRAFWYLIRMYWTEEKWFRVRDNHDGFKFVALNKRMTYAERLRQYVDRGMDLQQATQEILPPQVMQSLTQRMQVLGQQLGQSIPPGTPPEVAQQVIQQKSEQLFWLAPELQGQYVAADVSKMDVDIILDVTIDNPVVENEQFRELSELARHGVQIPPRVLIQASTLRDKQAILKAMEPDPQQVQIQMQQVQLQMQEMAAKIQELQAKAAKAGAEAQKALVEAQISPDESEARIQRELAEAAKAEAVATILPYEGQKDRAQAIKFVAEAQREPDSVDSKESTQ